MLWGLTIENSHMNNNTRIFDPSIDDPTFQTLRDWKFEQSGIGVTFIDWHKKEPLNTVKIKRPTLRLEFQGKFVAAAIRYDHDAPHRCGVRGRITEFSPQSRTRLFDVFHRLDITKKPIFLTLTYMERWYSVKTSKQHFRAFLERVRRKYPQCSAIWRLEFQERGAPHFHIMFFNLPYWKKESVQKVWAECINERGRQPFTRIEQVNSHKGVMSYVSKYIAKLPEGGDSGFNSPTYLHAYQQMFGKEIGRVWGYFQRQNLPWAERFYYERDLNPVEYAKFRWLAMQHYPPIAKYMSWGFRLYVPRADRWMHIARTIFDYPYASHSPPIPTG